MNTLPLRNPAETRTAIAALDGWLREVEQAEIPVRHEFIGGIYARTMFMRKGIIATSKCHLVKHRVIVSFGKIAVVTDRIQEIIVAPCSFITYPGTKRALLALEDTVWTTYHETDCQDVETLENTLVVDSYDDYLALTSGRDAALLTS